MTILPEEFAAAQRVLNATDVIPPTRAYTDLASRPSRAPDRTYNVVVYRSLDRSNLPCYEHTRTVIEEFRPDYIFLVGIAGGISGRDDIGLGDVVLVDYVHYAEYMKLAEGKSLARHQAFDQPSAHLRGLAEPLHLTSDWQASVDTAAPEKGTRKVLTGPLLASEKVLSDESNEYQQKLIEHYDHCVAVDMESYGFCKAVSASRVYPDYNPQLLVIRGISDLLQAQDNSGQRRQWKTYACDTACTFAAMVAMRIAGMFPFEEDGS